MNKKGIFFTIMAISVLSLFLISYSIYAVSQSRESINKRIDSMNNFVFLIEDDLPRQLYISGFRILFLFEKKIVDNGNYISNLNSTFREMFFNGTIYGENQELMNGVTFSGIIDSLNQKASKINVNITMSSPKISINQDDPWNVKINFSSDLLVEDIGDLVLWNKTYTKEIYISIENFEDPIYIIGSNGLVTNKINKTLNKNFVNGSDVSVLLNHLENSYYTESNIAPSFLDRLEGRKTSNANGIESLIYIPKLSQQGLIIKTKSSVDYIYFSDNNPSYHHIQGMPNWFMLDDEHLNIYGVSSLAY